MGRTLNVFYAETMISDEYKCFENLNSNRQKAFIIYCTISVDFMDNFIETGPLVFFYDATSTFQI